MSTRDSTTATTTQKSSSDIKMQNGTSSPAPGTIKTMIPTNITIDPDNAWSNPVSTHDFRSDTMTTPTLSMLNAIIHTTLYDDVPREDPTTNALETHIASLTHHEAALLVLSGTMGNQICLKTHLSTPPHSVLCDARAHVYKYEAGGVSNLSGAMVIPVPASNGRYLTLSDIKRNVVISDDIHSCPTRVISLENTCNGLVMPLAELRRIRAFAVAQGIKMHLDGARIWEVAATGTHGTLAEYTSCFDSVSLCFSKGLGAPVGSVIVGSEGFITHARRIRKMIGGGTRQSGIIAAAARVAVDETFGIVGPATGYPGEGKLKGTHVLAKRIAGTWEELGGKLQVPVQTNMVWLDLTELGVEEEEFVELLNRNGLKGYGGRIVVHYQITEDAVRKLQEAMKETVALARERRERHGVDGGGKAEGDNETNGVKKSMYEVGKK
jgi:threonine aldolase